MGAKVLKRPSAVRSKRSAATASAEKGEAAAIGRQSQCNDRGGSRASRTAMRSGPAGMQVRKQMQSPPSPASVLMLKNGPENVSQPQRFPSAVPLMLKNTPENTQSSSGPLHVKVVKGIAVPCADWRVVPKGVACPGGCEYRMDLTSG